jgi:hypothetical protein
MDAQEQEMIEAGQFSPPGRPQASAADLGEAPHARSRILNPDRIRRMGHQGVPRDEHGNPVRVHGDPRATMPTPPVQATPQIPTEAEPVRTPAATPEAARALVARVQAERAAQVQQTPDQPREPAYVVAEERPTPEQRQAATNAEQRRMQARLLREAQEQEQAEADRLDRERRAARRRAPREETPREEAPVMATRNGSGGRLSRWNLPSITRQTNVKATFVQTSNGLLANRDELGKGFPKFMIFVTIVGMILSFGSTINAVQFVVSELARRHILGISLVVGTDGTLDISTSWKFVAIFVGSICAAGVAWGQAQLSDQTTNNQSLAFWTLELLDGGMTYFFIAPVVIGILTIIRELNVQAFYTAAGAEAAIVCAFLLNQAVRTNRMDEELDPFWFKVSLGTFFILGNVLSRMLLPSFGDGDTAEGIVKQVVAAAFGICAFISFLSAYVPEQTAFGSRLRRVGRRDTERGAA